jgi:hypothetical protein
VGLKVVGMKIMGIKDLPDRVTSVLRGAGIPVYVPRRVNGSQNNCSVIVPKTRRNEAVDLLHRAFDVVDGSRGDGAHQVPRAFWQDVEKPFS